MAVDWNRKSLEAVLHQRRHDVATSAIRLDGRSVMDPAKPR